MKWWRKLIKKMIKNKYVKDVGKVAATGIDFSKLLD